MVSQSKEQRFLEWKKRNERRMREMNIRPKVYEYVSRPAIVHQTNG